MDLFIRLTFFPKNAFLILLLCLNLFLKGIAAVCQMSLVSLRRIDLLLQDIHLAFQLPPHQPRIGESASGLLNGLVQTFDLFLNMLVFFFDSLVLLACLGKLSPGNPVLFLYGFQLLLQAGVLQKEHVNVQLFQFFLFLQINTRRLRLLFQRLNLFFQLRHNVVDTDEILLFVFQLRLCRRLPALKLYNPGGFVKEFPSFFRLAAQNLVDLSLSDNGIPFLTDTGIVK